AWLVGLLAVGGIFAAALLVPDLPVEWASLAAALVFPAALISAFDFHLANDRYYTEADIYGNAGNLMNVPGMVCWLAAILVGQLLDPLGPEAWVAAVPVPPALATDLPWRLIVALVAATVYFLIQRWASTRRAAVYEVRGVGVYGPQDEA
ncbi:MAG: hypothetical protein ACLFWM_13040, partial [Actinomycetota bacterium]